MSVSRRDMLIAALGGAAVGVSDDDVSEIHDPLGLIVYVDPRISPVNVEKLREAVEAFAKQLATVAGHDVPVLILRKGMVWVQAVSKGSASDTEPGDKK